MVRRFIHVALLSWLGVAWSASAAYAAPMLRFSVDGGAFTVVNDEGAGDIAQGAAGVITLSSNAIAGYPVVDVTGSTPLPTLAVSLVAPAGVHDLRIEFTDGGFTQVQGLQFMFQISGFTLPANSFISGSAYFDATDPQPAFSHETPIGSVLQATNPLTVAINGAAPPSTPYTLTQELLIHSTNSGSAAVNLFVGLPQVPTAVPEPASLSLLGLGLTGFAMRRWPQRRQN